MSAEWAETPLGTPALLKARLHDENGTVVEGAGEGELELSGPTVFDGYYRNARATEAAFRGRWLRTGDLFRRDEQGGVPDRGAAEECRHERRPIRFYSG